MAWCILPEKPRRAGITDFGVARVHEGLELRAAGFGQRILVFESAPPGARPQCDRSGSDADGHGSGIARESLSEEARRAGKRTHVQVKIDTGMGRLGLPAGSGRRDSCVRSSAHLMSTLRGVYSHFATSEDPDRTFALLQLERFSALLDSVRRAGVEIPERHMANSGAIIALPESHLDMVRPGIMLYGYPPGQGMPERYPVRPVLSLVSRVAFVKDVRCRRFDLLWAEVLHRSTRQPDRDGPDGLRRRLFATFDGEGGGVDRRPAFSRCWDHLHGPIDGRCR